MHSKPFAAIVAMVILIVFALMIGIRGNFQSKSVSDPNQDKRIIVTTSIYPLYFFAKEVGANHTQVTNITPAGSEPHDYELTPQDLIRIEKSDVLIINGGGLEPWKDKIKENLKGKNTTIVEAGADVMLLKTDQKIDRFQDPHVWLSPPLAKKQVEKISHEFERIDPAHASYYRTNAQKLSDKLEALDKKYREQLERCMQKDIVTSHAAFGYLAQSYGLNQIAISGLSPDEEPSPSKLTEIAKFSKEKHIGYIFFESLVSPKYANTIAKEAGAQTLVLNPIEGLTSEEVQSGKSYFSLMEDNLSNLRLALQCQ